MSILLADSIHKALRFARTIRHLRPRQIVGQFAVRIRPLLKCIPTLLPSRQPQHRPCDCWDKPPKFPSPVAAPLNRDAVLAGSFEFVGHADHVGWPPTWNAASVSLLWEYHLHYFDWIWALDYDDAKEAVSSWIEQHPHTIQATGWQPYPTSLRIMNWIPFFFGQHIAAIHGDTGFKEMLYESLFRQTCWLESHIETHVMGNHLMDNAAALIVAGSCFSGKEARRWQTRGCRLFRDQVHEQMLPDGMHFERSPMYHMRMLYLLQYVMAVAPSELRNELDAFLFRARRALVHLLHPDGSIALLNDSTFGQYMNPIEGLPINKAEFGPWSLPDAGYFGFRSSDGTYIVCDAGKFGPDYQPGHAHGDIFSFELSVCGKRVIVDSGVFDYGDGEERQYCRSTRAHSTIEINGKDQGEFWGAFFVGRRGRPHEVEWHPTPAGFSLSGWHDGYRWMKGRPIHKRRFDYDAGAVRISDEVTADTDVSAASRFHLHPDCRVTRDTEKCFVIECGTEVRLSLSIEGDVDAELESSEYYPHFGVRRKNQCIVLRAKRKRISIVTTLHRIKE